MAIVPAQDLLELGSEARMNTPAVAAGNWSWRAPEGCWTAELAERWPRWPKSPTATTIRWERQGTREQGTKGTRRQGRRGYNKT